MHALGTEQPPFFSAGLHPFPARYIVGISIIVTMCKSKLTSWPCSRCSKPITDPVEPPLEPCATARQAEKCGSIFTYIAVPCEPALCFNCSCRRQDKFAQVKEGAQGLPRGPGLPRPRRKPLIYALDPAEAWEHMAFAFAAQKIAEIAAEMQAEIAAGMQRLRGEA